MAVGNCVFVLCENEIYQIYLVSRSMDSWKLVIATNSTTAAVELNPCSCLLPVGENITALEVLVAHSYMTSSSQALVLVDRSQHLLFQSMLRNIVTLEAAVLLARHPHDVHDIIAELHCIVACMLHLGDWYLFPRLTDLMHQARALSFRQCHALIHRCAAIIDACDKADCSCPGQLASEMSYDEVAHAVRACDDVLVYLIPSEKAFYCQQLRPRMVSIMSYLDCSRSGCSVQAESVSSFPVSFDLTGNDAVVYGSENDVSELSINSLSASSMFENDSDTSLRDFESGSEHHFGRHVVRVRWLTANIVFDYQRFADVTCDSSNLSSHSQLSIDLDSVSASSIVDSDSDSSLSDCAVFDSEHHFGRHITRVRWMTSNILFEYQRFKDVTCDARNLSSQLLTSIDYEQATSGSVTQGDIHSVSPAAKRSRYASLNL
jgi:hypothetical protein